MTLLAERRRSANGPTPGIPLATRLVTGIPAMRTCGSVTNIFPRVIAFQASADRGALRPLLSSAVTASSHTANPARASPQPTQPVDVHP